MFSKNHIHPCATFRTLHERQDWLYQQNDHVYSQENVVILILTVNSWITKTSRSKKWAWHVIFIVACCHSM